MRPRWSSTRRGRSTRASAPTNDAAADRPADARQLHQRRRPRSARRQSLSRDDGVRRAGDSACPAIPGFGTVQQGYLENSNVDPVKEITELISAQRAYEMNSKVIQAADEMFGTVSQGLALSHARPFLRQRWALWLAARARGVACAVVGAAWPRAAGAGAAGAAGRHLSRRRRSPTSCWSARAFIAHTVARVDDLRGARGAGRQGGAAHAAAGAARSRSTPSAIPIW